MKKVLFLDDCPDRHRQFMENWIGHLVDWAKTADEALKFLNEKEYDLIMLDHDLALVHYEKQCTEGTGYVVAEYIAGKPRKFQNSMIVVHSLNFSGRNRMMTAFRDAGVTAQDLPWGWLKVKPE